MDNTRVREEGLCEEGGEERVRENLGRDFFRKPTEILRGDRVCA